MEWNISISLKISHGSKDDCHSQDDGRKQIWISGLNINGCHGLQKRLEITEDKKACLGQK